MKIYLDLVFFTNFFFDTILLETVNLVLKRNRKFRWILLGGLIGSVSTFFLFFPLSSWELFLGKVILSFLMVLASFSYTSPKELGTNWLYLYFVSILLGGFLYYLDLEVSYEKICTILVKTKGNKNLLLFLLAGPGILFYYLKQEKRRKKRNQYLYEIELVRGKKTYRYTGYLDTGNQLYDPYTKRPVHLLYDPQFRFTKKDKILYVPYHGLNTEGILPCLFFDQMKIAGKKEVKKVLIGFSREPFHIEGANMILHEKDLSS